MMPKLKLSTAVVTRLPIWKSSGAKCVTVPLPLRGNWMRKRHLMSVTEQKQQTVAHLKQLRGEVRNSAAAAAGVDGGRKHMF